jgi:hypothetical protein
MTKIFWILVAIMLFLMAWTQRELTSTVRIHSYIIQMHEQDIRALQNKPDPPIVTPIPNDN